VGRRGEGGESWVGGRVEGWLVVLVVRRGERREEGEREGDVGGERGGDVATLVGEVGELVGGREGDEWWWATGWRR